MWPGLVPSGWLLIVLFVATAPFVNPYIRGDGNGYYAYVRSAVIDGDLRFENEYRRGDPAFLASVTYPDGRLASNLVLGNGYVRNQWAVGPSLLWAPFFVLGHGVATGLNSLGWPVALDGYSAPYRWACALGTALYGFVGLMLACTLARRFVGATVAAVATVGVWFASPLPVYMYFLPFHVPALSGFVVSLFLWYWLKTRGGRTSSEWGLWGASAGLMVETYYLNAVCLLIAAFELGEEARFSRARPARARAGVAAAGIFGLGLALAVLPHIVVKTIVHGSPFKTGYDDQFFWGSPRLWHAAFASEHGMFVWTPVLLFATVGLGWLWRTDRSIALRFTLVLVAYYYAVASFQNWHGQSAFGNRFLVSLTPIFVVGFGGFLAALAKLPVIERHRRLGYGLVLGPLILWNVGLVFQWGTGLVPNRGPVDFVVAARNQVTEVPRAMVGFMARYFTERGQLTREVEQRDALRVKGYHPQR